MALKPVETGVPATATGQPVRGSDAQVLEQVSTHRPSVHPLYGFPEPLSAHLAARHTRRRVSLAKIAQWVEAIPYDICIVETAGGALSPLTRRKVNLDLAAQLAPAVWTVVAADALGVLHDVRATWMAAQASWRAPDYLVLSASRPPDPSTGTNARELSRVGLPRPIAVVPHGCSSNEPLIPLARALIRLNHAASHSAPPARGPRAGGAPRRARRSPGDGSRPR